MWSYPMTAEPSSKEPVEIFYSYSHKDEALRDELEKHLGILKRRGIITDWHDRRIGAGKEWEGAIDRHLESAKVILLLISSDFIASDYCYDIEMKRAMQRHEAGEARVHTCHLAGCKLAWSTLREITGPAHRCQSSNFKSLGKSRRSFYKHII